MDGPTSEGLAPDSDELSLPGGELRPTIEELPLPGEELRPTIEELPLPATLDGADGVDFVRAVGLLDDAVAELLGHRDFAEGPGRHLAMARPSPYGRVVILVARSAGGEIVGMARLGYPLSENTDMVEVRIAVVPALRRRGIGSRLLDAAARRALADGRGKLDAWVDYAQPPEAGEGGAGVVRPAEGAGGVPADAVQSRFAVSRGLTLQQVERVSRLDVPIPSGTLDRLEAQARDAAGNDYELVGWSGPVPQELVEGYCRLMERMDIDPPQGGLTWDPSVWDAERVRVAENRARERESFHVVTCARHLPSGILVAFSVLEVVRNSPEAAFQEDTLVLSGHRGHRLGLLVKLANYRRLVGEWPTTRHIYTWNAEENSHMLAINTAMGFRPVQAEGAWEKRLVQNAPAADDPQRGDGGAQAPEWQK